MRLGCSRIGSLLFGALLLVANSGAYAAIVSLNNTVMISGMNWMEDLSSVESTSATGSGGMGTEPEVMDNMDGTTSYMGMDSVLMMSSPAWDYSWDMTADPDPFIAGSFTVTNTSMIEQTFDITFGLPIAPEFTDGYMSGRLSATYHDADNEEGATLSLNTWEGLIDGSNVMDLFAFAGPCVGTGCSVDIAEVSQGPTLYSGAVNSTIGIHMNFALSAGDSATFDTRFEVNPVPVPAAVWLFSSGLLGLLGAARRKKV